VTDDAITIDFCSKQAMHVTDLQGPPSVLTKEDKLNDLKRLAWKHARDQESYDDTKISYLEIQEEHNNDNLRLAQMLAM
jgi:hypothetical protein